MHFARRLMQLVDRSRAALFGRITANPQRLAVGLSCYLFVLAPVVADDGRSLVNQLRCVNAGVLKRKGVPPVLTIAVDGNVAFPSSADRLLANHLGDKLAIYGGSDWVVLQLPRSVVEASVVAKPADEPSTVLSCPSLPVPHSSSRSAIILHVQWHPLSSNHLMVLTDDHLLRLIHVHPTGCVVEHTFDLEDANPEKRYARPVAAKRCCTDVSHVRIICACVHEQGNQLLPRR